MSEHMDAIEAEIDDLWRKVLEAVGGDEEAAATVMKANADIALDSNLREKARRWLERNTDTKEPSE